MNTFFLGRDWELENSSDIIYPLFQVYPEVSRMPITAQGDYKTIEMELNCKVLDLVQQNENDERDVHSDTLRIAQDIVNELNQHPFYQRSNAQIVGDISFTALEEFEDDFTAGWEFTITLKLININNFCGLPMEDITGYSAAGPVYTGYSTDVQYLQCNTVTACTTLQDYVTNRINTIPTADTANYYTTGATLIGTTAVFDRNDQLAAYSLQLSGLTSGITISGNYLPLSGGTVTGDTTFQSGVTSNKFYVSGYDSVNPGYSNAIDTNTGLMFDGPDILSLHTGGPQRLLINAAGQITNGSHLAPSGIETYFTGNTRLDNLSAQTLYISGTSNFRDNIQIASGKKITWRTSDSLLNGMSCSTGDNDLQIQAVNSGNFSIYNGTFYFDALNASQFSWRVGNSNTPAFHLRSTGVLEAVSISATTLSGGTIYSGNTNLQTTFNNINDRFTTKTNRSGDTFTGQVNATALSATTISGGTYYSGSTPISNYFISTASTVVRDMVSSTFDGLGGVIATGSTSYLTMGYSGTFTGWDIIAPTSGSVVVDVWKAAGSIPTSANSITGTEKPTITLGQLNSDTNLTSWSTSFSAGDVLAFYVEQATGVTKVSVSLRLNKQL